MAVSYGSAVNTSTNGMRAGLELTTSSTSTTTTISWELWLWTKRAAYNTSASYSMGGSASGSGSFSFNHTNNSSDWPTSNRTKVASGSFTRTRQYGSSQTVTVSGSISGVSAVPGTASHSRSVTVPARPVEAPLPPSGAVAERWSGDTQTRVSWTRNASTARPYESQILRRRVWDGSSWSSWTTRATLSGTATSYVDATSPNWRYQYGVRAVNSQGASSFSFTGFIDTTPAAPDNVRVVPSLSGTSIRWSTGSRPPALTRIARQEGEGPWIDLVVRPEGATNSVHVDPNPAVSHRYRLRHEGSGTPALNSDWAYSSRVQVAAPPAAPTGLGPSTPWDATEDRELQWTHVPTDGSEQAAFQVEHRPQGGSWTAEAVVASSVSRWTLPGGTYANGDSFEWRVRTWGVHPDPGPYSASNVQAPQARPTVAINTPEEGQVIDTSTVEVTWGYAQEQGSAQAAWRWTLERAGQVVQEGSGSGTTTSRTISGLEDDASYTLRVEVRSSHGLWSAADVVTFDVDYLSPQAPEITSVDWDMGLGAAVVQIAQPVWSEEFAEPAYHQLWRAIDDGPWLLIADEIPLDTSVSDPIPAIGDGRVNHYRATTVSALPSTADSETVKLTVPSTGKGGTGGWVYLNAGPGMSQVCRVRANATRSDSEGVAKVLHHFAGRPSPVEYAGTARAREWDVSARIAPDYDGASTRDELVELQALPAPVCYRDPLGARWFASMGPVASSWRSIMGEVSWSMTEVDVTEGLDVQQRDTEGSAA